MKVDKAFLNSHPVHATPEEIEFYKMKRMLLEIPGRQTLAIYEDPDAYIEVYYEPAYTGLLTVLRVPKATDPFNRPNRRGSFQLEKEVTYGISLSQYPEICHILTRVIEKTDMEQIFRCSLDKKRVYDWNLPEKEVAKLVLQDLYAVFLELLKTDDELVVLNLDANDRYISADEVFEREVPVTFANMFAKVEAEIGYREPIQYIAFGNKTLVELNGEFRYLPIDNEQMLIDIRPFWYNSTELLFSTVCEIYVKVMLAIYKAIKENTISNTVAIAKPSYSNGYVVQSIKGGLIEPYHSDIVTYSIVSDNEKELVMDCIITELSSTYIDVDRYTICKETGNSTSKHRFSKTIADYDEYYYEEDSDNKLWFYSEAVSLLFIQELQELNEGSRKNELYDVDSELWKELKAKYKAMELKHNKHYGYPERDAK